MVKNVIQTEEAPKAIGPYSQAVTAGQLIFISGQLGLNPEDGEMREGIHEQTVQSLQNLKSILEEAGSSLDNVLKTTIFLRDLNDFTVVNQIYGEFFLRQMPARSTVQVAELPKQGLVEIEAIALIE